MSISSETGRSDADVIGRVTARIDLDELAEAIAERYRSELRSFDAVPWDGEPTALLPGIRDGIDEIIAIVAEQPEHVGRTTADQRLAAHFAAGVTPPDTFKGLSMAGEMIWDALVEAAEPEDLPYIPTLAGRIFRFLGGVPRASRESTRRSFETGAEARNAAFIRALLDPDEPAAHVEGFAAELGISLEAGWRPVISIPDGQSADLLAMDIRAAGCPAAARDGQALSVVPSDGCACTTPGRRAVLIVVGDECTRPSDFAPAFRTLDALVRIARRYGLEGEVGADQLLMERLLLANPGVAAQLRERVAGTLRRHEGSRGMNLLDTLVAYALNDFDRGRTAAALHLHANSLVYRLRRIGDLTGLDPGRSEDQLLMVLGVTAHLSQSDVA